MTLLVDSPGGPGIHALVVGVGDYPWLLGGAQPTFAQHGGMGQLTSAPISARAIARWLLTDFAHPTLPLRSLDLLLSDPAGDTFTDPQGTTRAIERGRFGPLFNSILAWFQRGAADAENLTLFFFSGHGLGKGSQTILLAEDFGQLPGTLSLNNALDFAQFYLGMDFCAARRQCFFVDACRNVSPFAGATGNFFGQPVIPPGTRLDPLPRSAPVYYSAVPGQTAFGRPGLPSCFTEALLSAFRGSGADDALGPWTIETGRLHLGIHAHLQRLVARTAAQGQLSMVDGVVATFSLHRLPGLPLVPVEVTCLPESHNPGARLRISGHGAVLAPPAPAQGPWDLDLEADRYRFEVALAPPQASPPAVEREVRPHFRRVELPVP